MGDYDPDNRLSDDALTLTELREREQAEMGGEDGTAEED